MPRLIKVSVSLLFSYLHPLLLLEGIQAEELQETAALRFLLPSMGYLRMSFIHLLHCRVQKSDCLAHSQANVIYETLTYVPLELVLQYVLHPLSPDLHYTCNNYNNSSTVKIKIFIKQQNFFPKNILLYIDNFFLLNAEPLDSTGN